MENITKKLRVRVKRTELVPLRGEARVFNQQRSSSSTRSSPEPPITRRCKEHKEAFIDFEKKTRVSLLHLKAAHTLWQEMSGKLNAITSEKGAREPTHWRASMFNWRNRVMAKKGKKENMSPIDKAASEHWSQSC